MSLSLKDSNVDGRLSSKLFIQPVSSGTSVCVGGRLCLSPTSECCTDSTVYRRRTVMSQAAVLISSIWTEDKTLTQGGKI